MIPFERGGGRFPGTISGQFDIQPVDFCRVFRVDVVDVDKTVVPKTLLLVDQLILKFVNDFQLVLG